MSEDLKVNLVDSDEPKSIQEEEKAVLENAAESGEIAPESAGIQEEDGVYKINLDKPTNTETDAIQERETEKVDVGEQARDGEGVESGVREQSDEKTEGTEDQSGSDESPIEYIQDETSNGDDATTESSLDTQPDNATSEEGGNGSEPVHEPIELPEGVDKLVEFMKETGGTLEDYLHLNKDVDNMNTVDLLREHYKQQNPDLTNDEISFMLEDEFAYDQEVDSERDIKKKQIAYKRAVSDAKNSIKSMRDKFYQDLKFSRGVELSDEQKEAINSYEKQKQLDALNSKVSEDYKAKTNSFFNDFKGFEFKLNDKKVRYKVADTAKTKEYQLNPNNWMSSYTDEKGYLTDPAKWHKAMYAANNIDKIAQHFYDQGRADAVKSNAAKAKNIDMEPRQNHGEVKVDGQKIRVVSGDNSDKLRFKIGKYK